MDINFDDMLKALKKKAAKDSDDDEINNKLNKLVNYAIKDSEIKNLVAICRMAENELRTYNKAQSKGFYLGAFKRALEKLGAEKNINSFGKYKEIQEKMNENFEEWTLLFYSQDDNDIIILTNQPTWIHLYGWITLAFSREIKAHS